LEQGLAVTFAWVAAQVLSKGSCVRSGFRCGGLTCISSNDLAELVPQLYGEREERKQHISHALVQEVRQRVEADCQYQDAVREVLTANTELLVLARKQRQKRRR
jgi:hypothetical protein